MNSVQSNHLFAPTNMRLILLIAVAIMSGCVTKVSEENWPTTLPERSLFTQTWAEQKAAGTNDSSLEKHLTWIRRFYEGSVIYPIGWNYMSEGVLESLDTQKQKNVMARRLQQLGILICIEWAQNNRIRKIDSKAVAVWGNALRTAVERKEQSKFVSKIELDVNDLLSGKLDASQIVRERYYPPEDYDNF